MSRKNKDKRLRSESCENAPLQEYQKYSKNLGVIIFITCFSICSIAAYFFMTEMFQHNDVGSVIDNEHFYTLRSNRSIVLVLAIVCGWFIVWRLRKAESINRLLLIQTLFTSITLFEIALMYVPLSDGVGTSDNYAHVLWSRKNIYTKDYSFKFTTPFVKDSINVNLRKNPFPGKDSASFCSKKEILVVGDSYVYGDGIVNGDDIFSQVLQRKLVQLDTNSYVVNLGVRGIDTYQEMDVLNGYVQKVVARYPCNNFYGIIWSYCFNDIEPTAGRFGQKIEFEDHSAIESFFGFFKQSSFVGNFAYWSVMRRLTSSDSYYKDFLRKAYRNPEIVHKTIEPILVAKAELHEKPFSVVIFPILQEDLDFSDSLYQNLYLELQKNNIRYTIVGRIPEVQKLSRSERIVSMRNPHPSKEVHKIVGEILAKMFSK